ncbi:beta-N-acetylglucosaminidase domain-containing protein [Persephonella sp.]
MNKNKQKNVIYGVVEGFFSRPLPLWTTEQRLNTIRFISLNAKKINTYFYCPKQDVYITTKWNLPYPTDKLLEISKVVKLCQQNGVNFIYGLNPQIESSQNVKDLVNKIIKKFSQLKTVGCTSFALLFDDIPLAYDVIDEKFTSQSLNMIKRIVKVVNNVYEKIKKDTDEFLFCGPDYFFTKKTPITEEIKNKLNSEIPLIWTGNKVFTPKIRLKDLEIIKKLVGKDRKIIWWSNYPVNDCEQNVGMYNLGAFQGLSKLALEQLYGIVVNPMREAYANLPFYTTFSNYLSNPDRYRKNSAWNKALKLLFGKNYGSYRKIMKEFSQRNPTDNKPKWLYSLLRNATSIQKIKERIKEIIAILETVKINQPKTEFGQLTITSLENLLQQAKYFTLLIQDILENRQITKKKLALLIFPTNYKIARYYPEIYRIVVKRIKLLPERFTDKRKLEKFAKLNNQFNKLFVGRKKLNMSRKSSKEFKKANRDLVEFEKECFLKALNDTQLTIKQKILLLSKRQNINRFFKN